MFVVIGTATVDLFISGVAEMPRLGGDEFTTANLAYCERPLQMVLGGNGANSAYALASLGAATALGSATGLDKPGEMVTGWLAQRGVDLHALKQSADKATATTTIVTDDALNRVCFYHPGALHHYSLADVPVALLRQAEALLLSSYPILPQFRPHGFAGALALARQGMAVTALDIGPAIGRPAELAELRPLLPLLDYFIANEHELAVCTGAAATAAGAALLLEAGAAAVVVKQGWRGATLYQPGRRLEIAGFAVETQFTVGAGDAFNAGFLYGVRQGMAPETAVRFGNATAALVVSSAQGILGCPTLAQVERLLAA